MRFIPLLVALWTGMACAASVDRYREFLNETRSARAGFEQKVYDRNGKLVQASKGSFVFQRPGKFRWVYDKPADQVIVGDGSRVWIYDRELNQVTVRKMESALGSTPAALLAGGTGVEKAFALSDAGPKNGLEWVLATPRQQEAGFESVRMGFKGNELVAMELKDQFGQRTELTFSQLQRNPKINPDSFRFEPPKGADVLGEQ